MKSIIIIFVAFSLYSIEIFGQDLNGIYSTKFTLFENPNDLSNNFKNPIDDFIIFDINEVPNLTGSITISGKDINNETVNMKFVVFGDKKVDYNDGYTDILFNSKLYILNVEVQNQTYLINYIFSNKEKYLIVTFPGGSHQTWIINEKL